MELDKERWDELKAAKTKDWAEISDLKFKLKTAEGRVRVLEAKLETSYEAVDGEKRLTVPDALFGFCAWLTGREEVITVGGSETVGQILEPLRSFLSCNGGGDVTEDFPRTVAYPVERGQEEEAVVGPPSRVPMANGRWLATEGRWAGWEIFEHHNEGWVTGKHIYEAPK